MSYHLSEAGPFGAAILRVFGVAAATCIDGSPRKEEFRGRCLYVPSANVTRISTDCAGLYADLAPGDRRTDPRCRFVVEAPGTPAPAGAVDVTGAPVTAGSTTYTGTVAVANPNYSPGTAQLQDFLRTLLPGSPTFKPLNLALIGGGVLALAMMFRR